MDEMVARRGLEDRETLGRHGIADRVRAEGTRGDAEEAEDRARGREVQERLRRAGALIRR